MNVLQPPAGLAALADYLFARSDVILSAWRDAVERDPKLGTACALSRSQFNDHIPAVLAAFDRELRGASGGEATDRESDHKESAAEHGLQRWHHGYNQEEVMREWGHLHLILLSEVENYGETPPKVDAGAMRTARLMLARLCNDGVVESAIKYLRLQQAEAAGRLLDLERAQTQIEKIERERAAAWREAAHDLRNQVWVVNTVTETLKASLNERRRSIWGCWKKASLR